MKFVIFTSTDANSSKFALNADRVEFVGEDNNGFMSLWIGNVSYPVTEPFDVVVARLNGVDHEH